MKYVIVIMLGVGLMLGVTAYAGKLIKAEEFGYITIGADSTTIYKVSDPATGATCYALKGVRGPAHSLSCVK